MEETLKISIGGVSFTVNKDGFSRLDSYLKAIEHHYSRHAGGREIVDDIESRIAELLLENYNREDIVNLSRVESVISIMGNPENFEDGQNVESNSGNYTSYASTASSAATTKRRLFRDTEDRMIGGVCSGLSHYFKIDPSILRIVLAVLLALHVFVNRFYIGGVRISILPSLFSVCLIGYIILWIVVPSAKTYSQKCQMTGSDPGIKGAEENYIRQQKPNGTVFGRIVKILLGSVFILTGLAGIATTLVALFAAHYWHSFSFFRTLTMMQMAPGTTILLYTLILLCTLIPFVALLYVGIRWLFNLNRPKRCRPGLIMFLLWVASIVGLIIFAKLHSNVYSGRYFSQSREFPKYYDTLYVEYAALPDTFEGEATSWERVDDDMFGGRWRKMNIAGLYVKWNDITWVGQEDDDEYVVNHENSFRSDFNLYVSRGRRFKKALAFYPELDIDHKGSTTIIEDDTTSADRSPAIVKDTTVKADLEISAERLSFFGKLGKYDTDTEDAETLIEIKDSLITLKPKIITRKKKFDGICLSARLYVPDSCTVIIKTP